MWRARRRQEVARLADAAATPVAPSCGPIVAIAGIAHPGGFFSDLKAAGWTIARAIPYPDHHPYTSTDVERIMEAAGASGARAVVTTEKDLVRLLRFRPFAVPVAFVPIVLDLEPPDTFDGWLVQMLDAARAAAAQSAGDLERGRHRAMTR